MSDNLSHQLDRAVPMVAKQDQIVWTIFGIFWAANAVLLAALFANGAPDRSSGLVLSVAGAGLCFVWVPIQWLAIGWLRYYETVLHRLEDHLSVPTSIALSALRNTKTAELYVGRVGRGVTVRRLMVLTGILTAVGWMAAWFHFLLDGAPVMDWVNANSGAVQAVSTVVLVLLTTTYVVLTWRISKAATAQAQHLADLLARAQVVAFISGSRHSVTGQRLYLRNEGQATARRISVLVDGRSVEDHPLTAAPDRPIATLGPRAEAAVLLSASTDNQNSLHVSISWDDDSGERGTWESDLSL